MKLIKIVLALGTTATLMLGAPAQAENPMGFFVTSAGPGDGGNQGGLEGADAGVQDRIGGYEIGLTDSQ